MLLADAINLPLVAAYGLVAFIPLNLLVAFIESSVMRTMFGIPVRQSYRRVFWANVASTGAGVIVLGLQDPILYAVGVLDSIPKMVHWFPLAAIGLIILYYLKSVLVEWMCIARKGFVARTGLSRKRLFTGVAVANLASYCVVAPIFFFTMRPTFGGLEITHDTRWTANASMAVYFIDPPDKFIKRIRLDGSDKTTLVPFAARDFIVTPDEAFAVYRGTDGNLYAYERGKSPPEVIWKTTERFSMVSVAFSSDRQQIAFADEPNGLGKGYRIQVFDRRSHSLRPPLDLPETDWDPPGLVWSQNAAMISATMVHKTRYIEPGPQLRDITKYVLSPPRLALALRQFGNGRFGSSDDWGVDFRSDRRGESSIECHPFLYGFVSVRQGETERLRFANDYGFTKLNMPPFVFPTLLPAGSEAILAWADQLYVLDFENKRLGLLTSGTRYVLPIDRFRTDCEAETEDARMRR